MKINKNVPKELQYAVSSVVTSIPFKRATGYVNKSDTGVEFAVQGLKSLCNDNQYKISVSEISDGYVYSIAPENIGVLLDTIAPDNGLIDKDWVFQAQQYEENEGSRFVRDYYKYALVTSTYAYISDIVSKADILYDMEVKDVRDVVNSLASCIASYREINDNAFNATANICSQFLNAIDNTQGLTASDQRFKSMIKAWLDTINQMHMYLMNTSGYMENLQVTGDSFIWNIAISGINSQTTTYHKNILYPIYNITFPSLYKAIRSFNWKFSDVTIIDVNDGTEAYNINTFAQQGKAIIKKCCKFADSGNGVILRIMFTPRKVVVSE